MDSDDKEVQFNQAVFQQKRIDQMTMQINMLWMNPLGLSGFGYKRNYEIIFDNLKSIFAEISLGAGKVLNKKDEDEINDKFRKIKELMLSNPAFPISARGYNGIIKSIPTYHNSNWDALNGELYECQILVYKMLNKYGFGNPVKDDDWDTD